MGRVLPGLTTRSGAISAADALGTTRDQQLQNALRRAAFQKAEERKTPEGMLRFAGQAAQTVGQVAGALDKAGTLIGKIPLPQALRTAAAAKARQEMVTPQVKKDIQRTVAETGLGQGAPVTEEIARGIRSLSQQGQAGRIAAQALSGEVERDREMRALRDRSAAAEAEVEQLEQDLLPVEKVEDLTAEEVTEQAMRATEEAEQVVDEATQQERQAEQQAVIDTMAGAEAATAADIEQVRREQLVQALGSTPRERQDQLLARARSAFTQEDQARLLAASDLIDLEPTRVSDLFDTRGGFRRKLAAAFPTAAQQLSAQKAAATSERASDRLQLQIDRLKQQREIETERQEAEKKVEARRKAGQEADDKRADERLKFDLDKHRFNIAKDARDREEWAYDYAFKQQKHKDMMDSQSATRKLRDKISRRAGTRADRQEQIDNKRNVDQAIRDETKAVNKLASELSGHLKQANAKVEEIKADKTRYEQRLNLQNRDKRRAYKRNVLGPNKGKDPVIEGLNQRLKAAENDVADLKRKRKRAEDVKRSIGKLGTKARQFGNMMNYEDSLRLLDRLGKHQQEINFDIFDVDN